MTYLYEQLDPERFQQLCQALISLEFPGTQCLPVAQRDGGRDAVQLFANRQGAYRIFQVKFVRNPFIITDVHKWLVDTMKGELPKIKEILEKKPEAVEYIIISNVAGTAYPETGSIDTLNASLNADMPVPIRAWWRDDLDRRCDGRADVKWSYPEILRGTDLLQSLAEATGPELSGERLDVLRSFAVGQFEMDNEVRFKQVELSNEILNLFVDVPAVIPLGHEENRRKSDQRTFDIQEVMRKVAKSEPTTGEPEPIGAATLLLHEEIAKLSPLVVLEGGPGQGKSTLAQYLCQVHRMKIFGSPKFTELPREHQPASVRLPIKVDLREYAAWLAGKNPFAPEESNARPAQYTRSLESFISALISDGSGGRSFTVDDLSAVARASSLLIVLDGLDEVAEVRLRNEMVKEISAGARRLKESAAALQILVTTRPSALAEVSQFPATLFQRWTLTRLGRALIEEYAERWAKSRRLLPGDLAELRRTLAEKLDQPHMRDLARNPMQLAILLTVIHTRGASLPDKRTALYDIYVELFLAREAEKSEIVKRRQDLLIDIHRYLAWVLHSEAETGRALGKIEAGRLRELIKDYLISEGRDPAWTDELFRGLAQRVVFLVGAVEGLFEFEVQPLREYFAGRFLYETAPYSPVGSPKKGTKDERFDAVARNTHWLNVTRFYAGCFSKGELPSLVDRLEVLCADRNLSITSYPRSLAATLVADWVFSQNPRSLKKVIDLILDRDGYRSLIGEDRYSVTGGELITLPDGCGRVELLERCFEVLKGSPPRDVQISVTALAKKNGTRAELRSQWLAGFSSLSSMASKISWVWSGYFLGVLNSVTDTELSELLDRHEIVPDDQIVMALASGGRARYFTRNANLIQEYKERVLDGYVKGLRLPRKIEATIDLLSMAVTPGFYFHPYYDTRRSFGQNVFRHFGLRPPEGPTAAVGDQDIDTLVRAFEELLGTPSQDTVSTPVREYIDRAATIVGERWAVWVMAFSHAHLGRRSKRVDLPACSLFDETLPLVSRAKYARLQAGNASWWKQELTKAHPKTRSIWALAALTFCGPATLAKLYGEMDDAIESLNDREAVRLFDSIDQVRSWPGDTRGVRIDLLPDTLSPRVAAALAKCASIPTRLAICDKYLGAWMGDDPVVQEVVYGDALLKLPAADWSEQVDKIRRAYRVLAGADSLSYSQHRRTGGDMPADVARKVASNPLAYPLFLVRIAETALRRAQASETVALSKVAADNGWFEEQ